MLKKILISALIIICFYYINDALTPKPCKVKVEKMSDFCKELVYSK